MEYYLCIDGGGTKTSFVLYNNLGQPLKDCLKGTCHLLQVPVAQAISTLQEGINDLLGDIPKEIVIISAGFAGYGNSAMIEQINKMAEVAFKDYEYNIYNDAEIALSGALNGQDGILTICGTGSIACSINKGMLNRSGGWGYLLGDEGSGYWVSTQLLNVFTRQSDGRQDKTIMYEYLKSRLNLSNDLDLINYVYRTLESKRGEIAKLSKLATELLEMNDESIVAIFENGARELASLTNSLAIEFEDQVRVVTYGGMFGIKRYLEMYQTYLNNKAYLVDGYSGPEYGAYLLARKYQIEE